MNPRWFVPLALAAVLFAGCGKDAAPTAPEMVVDFAPSRSRYGVGEDISATLRNLSRVPVYVLWSCPNPQLERLIRGQWERQFPQYNVACPLTAGPFDVPLPFPIPPGGLVEAARVTREMLLTEIGPGTYRFVVSANLDPHQYAPFASRTFEIVAP